MEGSVCGVYTGSVYNVLLHVVCYVYTVYTCHEYVRSICCKE